MLPSLIILFVTFFWYMNWRKRYREWCVSFTHRCSLVSRCMKCIINRVNSSLDGAQLIRIVLYCWFSRNQWSLCRYYLSH